MNPLMCKLTASSSMISKSLITKILGVVVLVFLSCAQIQAKVVGYELTIAQQRIDITSNPGNSMTINGAIPGPTLRFNEGDVARIQVHNRMKVETSIHWHGLLVPPGMDGVPNISFPPIKPGTTFTYEFPIRQKGTYWYHSHTNLQEQSGIYGSIVITPSLHEAKYDQDHVVLLSDWTDEDPHQVLRTLKRGSEWYAIEKGSGQSIFGAARLGMLGDYFKRELQRMPAMDIADVAYDRFLINGKPEFRLPAGPGETIRLRIIDGSATTYFHLQFAGGPMRIISADGQEVGPIDENRFLIGVAETYDVVVQVPETGAYEFRATAHDGSAHASLWIGTGVRHPAPDVRRPNLYHTMGDISLKQILSLTPAGTMGMSDSMVNAGLFDQPGMMAMSGMNEMESMEHGSGESAGMHMDGMDHASPATEGHTSHGAGMATDQGIPSMDMGHQDHSISKGHQPSRSGKKHGKDYHFLASDVAASPELAVDGMDASRPGTPYARLRSTRPTVFSKDKPVREIRLTLDGDMERYVWLLNNKPLSETDSIRIAEGEVVRFIMINRTMMHHPMHLHGHFFRVINEQGDHAPLKHTVDVAPMSTTVIEFDANEFGDWFFHCHLLYHMKSGMARLIHYDGFTIDSQLAAIRPDLYKDSWYGWGQADILNNMTEGFLTLSNTRNILRAEWEAGWQEVDDTIGEGIFTYDRYINRFFSVFAGVDFQSEGDEPDETLGVFGLRYLLPLNIESRFWVDSDGGARMNLEKSFELTPRLSLLGEAQYDTLDLWEGNAGLSYLVNKHVSLLGGWHSEYGFGGGLQVRF